MTKYYCATEAFVDVDDCEIYEGGASFELFAWSGESWISVAIATTPSTGSFTWLNYFPGSYQIDELGDTACYATIDRTDPEGNVLIEAGETTHVDVYNCGVDEQPTKQPIKYPNTGVGPVVDS